MTERFDYEIDFGDIDPSAIPKTFQQVGGLPTWNGRNSLTREEVLDDSREPIIAKVKLQESLLFQSEVFQRLSGIDTSKAFNIQIYTEGGSGYGIEEAKHGMYNMFSTNLTPDQVLDILVNPEVKKKLLIHQL